MVESVPSWWQRHRELRDQLPEPVDLAVAGGFGADRPAWAFAGGYQAAIAQLLREPGEPAPVLPLVSFCATEEGGSHPRSIGCTLRPRGEGGWWITGHKTFATLSRYAEEFLIVATTGQGTVKRPDLRVARLPASRAGLEVRPGPLLSMVPEIPHGVVHLSAAQVSDEELLPGGGYSRYLKPFRTVEDLCVCGAVLGWLLQLSLRFRWGEEIQEELLMMICATRSLCREDPATPAVHRALAGLLDAQRRLNERLPWTRVDETTRRRWMRDKPLMEVADRSREARLRRARFLG